MYHYGFLPQQYHFLLFELHYSISKKETAIFCFTERPLNPLILMLVYKNEYWNSLMHVLISKA